MTINIENITKSFEGANGSTTEVLRGVSFEIEEGSFTSIMGPSGCGKSTLLNIIAGLISKDDGVIKRDGRPVEPSELPFAYIFQAPRLLKWRTVGENISFALNAHDVPQEDHDERISDSLEMVGLGDVRDSYPLALSGGMRQRVGIARALSVEPDILLMDEPFSSLDEITARELREDIIDLWQETGKTIIFVTHDINEAVFLSDEILFLDTNGEIFNRAKIEFSRPRDFEDPDLLAKERALMSGFFEHMESIRTDTPADPDTDTVSPEPEDKPRDANSSLGGNT